LPVPSPRLFPLLNQQKVKLRAQQQSCLLFAVAVNAVPGLFISSGGKHMTMAARRCWMGAIIVGKAVAAHKQAVWLAASILVLLVVCSLDLEPGQPKVSRAMGAASTMALLWVTTPIPVRYSYAHFVHTCTCPVRAASDAVPCVSSSYPMLHAAGACNSNAAAGTFSGTWDYERKADSSVLHERHALCIYWILLSCECC